METAEKKHPALEILRRHETALARLLQLALVLLVATRITLSMTRQVNGFIDARYFVETARLVLQGVSPYHAETNPTIYKYPLQAPSMSLLSMPLCHTSEQFQNFCFFAGGLAAFLAFMLLVLNYYGYHPKEYLRPRWRNVPIWLTIAALCVSAPHLLMLRHGQNSSIAALLLFAALLYPANDRKWFNPILLGLAASTKYSLLTMQAPVLLLQRRWKLIAFSLALFLILALSVGLWLDGVIPAARDYIQMVLEDTRNGANSYSNATQFAFIHIGFFQNAVVNLLLKVLLVVGYFLALAKICRRRESSRLSALEWCAFTALTVTISYHRYYDAVLFLPFLGVVFLQALDQLRNSRRFGSATAWNAYCAAAILLFWATPFRLVYWLEAWLGEHCPMGNSLFQYYGHSPATGHAFFPLIRLIMLATTIWLLTWTLLQRAPADDSPDRHRETGK